MKKLFICSLLLMIIDQIAKLFVTTYYINANIILIPHILLFRPVQNTNLNWIANMLEYDTPILFMLLMQAFALGLILVLHCYLSYLWRQSSKLLNGMFVFFMAGIACSFIDVAFWGGSWDFIRFFDWFTFDLKDVYLNIGLVFLLIYIVNYYQRIDCKMIAEQRKQTSLWIWIRKGMPFSSTEEEELS